MNPKPTDTKSEIGEKQSMIDKNLSGNPLIADGGCIFDNGIVSASFKYAPLFSHLITKGQCISIIVLEGDSFTYGCTNGRPAKNEDLSMKVTDIRNNASPFEAFGLSGIRMKC